LVTRSAIQQFNIVLPSRQQSVVWGENLFHHPQSLILLKQLGRKFALITDPNLANRFAFWIESLKNNLGEAFDLILIPFSEQSKDRQTFLQIEKEIFERGVSKDRVILALGGGVIHDIVGFAASTILRGLPFVMIPTTLLAMCDACFGGKTAINAHQMKNALGSFYPAHLLLIDAVFIQTLPAPLLLEGMAEMIKCALIADRSFFDKIEETLFCLPAGRYPSSTVLLEWVKRAAEIKMKFVMQDPFDRQERMALNFAHTFGHALEIFSDHSLTHGIAVLWGIYFESALSYKRGCLPFFELERIQKLLSLLLDFSSLPCEITSEEAERDFMQLLMKDKKARQLPCFVLLSKIGKLELDQDQVTHPVSFEEIQAVMELQGWARV
jgi:3-dehydroquinate synthase